MKSKIIVLALTTTVMSGFAIAGCGTNSGSNGNTSVGSATNSHTTTLTLYGNGDTNVQQLWDKTIIPQFEAKYPGIKVKDVFLQHGNGDQQEMAKLQAATKTGKQSVDVDLFEGDPGTVQQGQAAGVWQKVTTSDIPNLANVQSGLLTPVNGFAVPYRASSVVLAYNSKEVPTPPKTFDDLIQWIKAHPGKFAYNDPSTGGSGQSFVISSIYKYMSPSVLGSSYDPSLESKWSQGLNMLKTLGPDMYQNGVYPKGNQGTLDLLANGDIAMAPAWSDQALSELASGQLPSNIKITQITPGFTGGGTYVLVPKLSAHKDAAYKFLNFLLSNNVQSEIVTKMNGYPAIQWNQLPADQQSKFASIAKDYRYWPGQYSADLTKLWQQTVTG
ncbi:extracellular solute-binding protein [Alicyclobacillus dauci]|uniref:Extracellular solute-binding protein n=1 Tax=Alicyclobacillus dauci TaxID=1475485 RepID=A0ABY6Z0B6_9BACL|nr:extracellular solute-binding protein [Alicyclobacillus dauci]WAH36315.1 extracellular solute-binding protein [Alicyclobacillus dauci]